MLNKIWTFMILTACIVGAFSGKIGDVGNAAIEGAGEGAKLVLSMLGILCFWTGLMEIAEKSGIMRGLSRILYPFTKLLFPKLKKDDPCHDAIVMNISANLLGMGNAATPLGLRAMKLLDERNAHNRKASNEMCMFVIINAASIQLLPTTLILLRQMAGSKSPAEIILPVWVVSVTALLVGVISAKIFQRRT